MKNLHTFWGENMASTERLKKILTDPVVKQAEPREKRYMISDERGLYLEIYPNGRKYWVIRYSINNVKHRVNVGIYPEVSLKQARDKNYEFRRLLKMGKPIGFEKETFATVAKEWLEKRMSPKVAESYLKTLHMRLDRYILPHFGHMRLEELNSSLILQLIRKIEDRGTLETALRIKVLIGQIFNYAIATSRAETNPTLALKGALQTRVEKNLAAITEPDEIAKLMRQIDQYPYDVVRCALKYSALVFCRPGEIRKAEWEEIDWEKREWRIPKEKMKMKLPHIVPLANQAINLLLELKEYTGSGKWLFFLQRGATGGACRKTRLEWH